MDDGDSHPASANFPQVNSQVVKHNLPRSLAAGYGFFVLSWGILPPELGAAGIWKRERI